MNKTRWIVVAVALALVVAFFPVFGVSQCIDGEDFGVCYSYGESLIGIRMPEPLLLVWTIAGLAGLGLIGWLLDRRERRRKAEPHD